MADERCIVGLDIGTSAIRVAIGEVDYDGNLNIVATASKKSAGLRNGVIVNIEDAKDVIKDAIEAASRVPSTVSHFKTERGNSLEMLERARVYHLLNYFWQRQYYFEHD